MGARQASDTQIGAPIRATRVRERNPRIAAMATQSPILSWTDYTQYMHCRWLPAAVRLSDLKTSVGVIA